MYVRTGFALVSCVVDTGNRFWVLEVHQVLLNHWAFFSPRLLSLKRIVTHNLFVK